MFFSEGIHLPDVQEFLGKVTIRVSLGYQYKIEQLNPWKTKSHSSSIVLYNALLIPTFCTGFKSRTINCTDVIIFRVMDVIVKGHCSHNVLIRPVCTAQVVLYSFCLGA